MLRYAGLAGALLVGGATGCARPFDDTRLTIGAGGSRGVYHALGGALADVWQQRLDLRHRPSVLTTAGSVENVTLLTAGQADVVFAQSDVAATAMTRSTPHGRVPRALARVYDDALQVVVPAESPIARLADLRGRRVSIGAENSGVRVIVDRLLTTAGISGERDLRASQLGIDESVAALRDGLIDAFFWSGGLPTGGVADLAARRPIRLLDLGDVLSDFRREHPVYDVGSVPAGTYDIPEPVTTLLVRNFLLVTSAMPDDLAEALVAGVFAERERLVQASTAGRAIDRRAAIGTQPVPLHPGAVRYYRAAKEY